MAAVRGEMEAAPWAVLPLGSEVVPAGEADPRENVPEMIALLTVAPGLKSDATTRSG